MKLLYKLETLPRLFPACESLIRYGFPGRGKLELLQMESL
ncbi:hypothetical protein SAMN05192544_112812 [Paraburkholderia hospita]|jgi:hypothetical protein|nr:hypothetical protein SAMN05192544_112812 [Paraburkholderia hospita]